MPQAPFFPALAVGVMCMLALYLILSMRGFANTLSQRRAAAVFSAAAGLLVFWQLYHDPALLKQMSTEVVAVVLGILIAFLYALRRML